MLINPVDQNDLTMRFHRAPQGKIAIAFDWLGVISLAISVLALIGYWLVYSLELEGLTLKICLTALNISIISFVSARLVELADRVLRISNRDHQ